MQVRPATSDDLEAIAECHTAAIRTFGPQVYDEEQVEAWVGPEDADPDYPVDSVDHRLVVAERAGDVAGFGDLVVPDREVTAVYVHPEHVGEGVGTALLAHLEGRAREAGLEELQLLSSLNAVGFYERAGYERRRETTHETSVGVDLQVVAMRKGLSGNS